MRRWRDRRGLSAAALAERVSALGWSVGQTTIAKIEKRRRGVSLDEALILAAALNVPPPVLFFGLEIGQKIAVTAHSTIHPDLARKWLAGDEPLASTERRAIGIEDWYGAKDEWLSAADPVRLYERLNEAQEAVQAATATLHGAQWLGNESRVEEAREGYAAQLRKLWDVLGEMWGRGVTPPPMPKEWREEARELGLKEGAQ